MKPSFETITRRSFLARSALITGSMMGASTLLDACGGGGSGSNQPPVTLTFTDWMSKGEDHPILNDFMKAYPNIKVVDQTLPGVTYDQALKPRLIAGNGPDVFLFQDYAQYIPYIQQGWMMDVTNEPGTKAMTQSQDMEHHYSVNGKLYGAIVNGGYSDQPVFYNKKYFAKLGLTPPTTLDAFYAVCDKIKAGGVEPLVFGGKDIWPISTLMGGYETASQAAKYGPNANLNLLLAKGQAGVEDIYGEAWRFFANLKQKGYIGKASETLTYDQSVQYFVDGKAAILPQGSWVPGLDAIKQADAASFELGSFAFPLPPYQGKIVTSFGADRSIGIYAHTKHAQEARLLYNFFLRSDNLKNYLQTQNLYTLTPGIKPDMGPALSSYFTSHQDTSRYTVLVGADAPDPHAAKVTIPQGFSDAVSKVYPDILSGASYNEELQHVHNVFNQVKGQITITNA